MPEGKKPRTRPAPSNRRCPPPAEDGWLPVVQPRTIRSPYPHIISKCSFLLANLVSHAKVPNRDASHGLLLATLDHSCSHVKSGFRQKKHHESKVLPLPDFDTSPCAWGTRPSPQAHGKDFAKGHTRRSADGNYRHGKGRVCRVPNFGHMANTFAVCLSRYTAQKNKKTV